jgi:hypothetical protein
MLERHYFDEINLFIYIYISSTFISKKKISDESSIFLHIKYAVKAYNQDFENDRQINQTRINSLFLRKLYDTRNKCCILTPTLQEKVVLNLM